MFFNSLFSVSIEFFQSFAAVSRRFVDRPNTVFLALPCLFGIMGSSMELRHLRYFQAVAEALSFTRAAAQLRIAQPALSRQVQDLEDEIGVDLMKRSPRGVTLTAEGKLFLEEVRELLKRADESVEKVRALARGEYGELHVGYAPTPTLEILPPALAAFQKAVRASRYCCTTCPAMKSRMASAAAPSSLR